MNAEKLKIIAIGMGYEAAITESCDRVCYREKGNTLWFDYSPDTTNNDQMVEIMERLKIAVHFWNEEWCANRYTEIDGIEKGSIGKTINEAVCNAAYEYFESDK